MMRKNVNGEYGINKVKIKGSILRHVFVAGMIFSFFLGSTPVISVDAAQLNKPAFEEQIRANSALEDGIYTVDVTTSSSMFKIYEEDKNTCKLIVVDGEMYAKFNLNGTSYKYLYMGNKEDAANAEASDYIKYKVKSIADPVLGSFEVYNYTIPVSELDKEIQVAAYSTKSGNWFDRTMTFSNPVNTAAEINKVEKSSVEGIKASAKKGKITVSWSKTSDFEEYQLYSSTKPFDGFKAAKSTKANKVTITGKKAGKTYYYKVRGVRSIGGKKVFSQFSKTVAIKAK